jgi:RNA polymerase sigma-70 factor (ECF subfamily)
MAGGRADPGREDLARLDLRFRRPLMSFFLRRIGHHAEAEDLTQQVFLRLSSATMAEVENVDGFVFTIAANLLRDRARANLRRREALAAPPERGLVMQLTREQMEERSPERVLLARESLSNVLACLDELGEKTRDIFILFRLENMKQKDIAALYGIGQSTVEKHVMKAALHLAVRFGTAGAGPDASGGRRR